MSRFTALQLRNWRNFKAVDAELQDRVVLVGPNASGKSNFLDAIRFLQDIVRVGGGFQKAVEVRGGISKLRSLSARRDSDIRVGVQILIGDEQWSYTLSFGQDRKQQPVIRSEIVKQGTTEILRRPDDADNNDHERLTQTFLQQVNANRTFRPIPEFLASVQYLHIVPQLVREPDRSVAHRDDPYGGDFLEQVAALNQKKQVSRLRQITAALKNAVPQLEEIQLERDKRGTPHLRGRFAHWRPEGAWLNENLLSDGTLRLIGLLWALLDERGPLLLEEPELSLHSGIVRYLPQMFANVQFAAAKTRQILVSTHSAEFLDDPGLGLDEVFILKPDSEGTSVTRMSDSPAMRQQVESGLPLSDIVIAHTAPANAYGLANVEEARA